MENSWIILIGLIGIVVLIVVLTQSNQTGLELRITDAPINVQSLLVNISHIRVSSSAGWISVNENSQVFDLVKLHNKYAILGDVNLPVGTYNQIRMDIESALVSEDGVNYQVLTIPSKELKLISEFNIVEGKKLVMTLDFDANNSVHTANDKLIMKPTVKVIYENVECVQDTDCPNYVADVSCGSIISCELNKCVQNTVECFDLNVTEG